jgi:hypothetical protein
MSIGRISGPLLKANLLREGVNLAFETDLLYLDVNNMRIGVNTTTPTHDLQVNGTTKTTYLETDSLKVGNITISGNTIDSDTGVLNLSGFNGTAIVYQNKLKVDFVTIDANIISTNTASKNLELRPDGTGTVEVFADTTVHGNIHATGNITADGDITIGDANTDNIVFNADIASDLLPDQTDFYNLGSPTQRWNNTWTNTVHAESITTDNLVVNGISINSIQGNIYYVSTTGLDTNIGKHPNDTFLTVKKALTVAVSGDTIFIYPGVYTEIFPLTVPVGVVVKGQSLRSVTIKPTVATVDKDVFLLNGETTVEDLTISDYRYNSGNNTGYAFRFATGFTVTTKSPYIRNVTVISRGSVTSASDPYGFDSNDAGKGALLDGSVANILSKEAACLFHSVTFFTPNQETLSATNGTRVEWLNCFSYFADKGMYLYSGATGFANAGKTALRLSGGTGTFNVGNTISYYDTDGVTVLASGTIAAKDTDGKLYLTGKVTGLVVGGTLSQDVRNTSNGATATKIELVDYSDFGVEVRAIGSATVYGNYGIQGVGLGVVAYLIGQNLAYVGVGKRSDNDVSFVIQANEIVETGGAKIYYNSVDHRGDFRIGDLFYVNQQNGTIEVTNANIQSATGVTFTNGGNTTYIDGTKIETGNLRLSGNTLESVNGTLEITGGNDQINFTNNVNIAGNLDVTGNVTISGNIQVGDQTTDTVSFVAEVSSDIIPKLNNQYNLGSSLLQWQHLYINEIDVGDINISQNIITSVGTNVDLILEANGSGQVLIPTSNVEITNDLIVNGNTAVGNININGTINHTGDYAQTGNTEIDGNLTVTGYGQFGNIKIDNNTISNIVTNNDIILEPTGTGVVRFENFEVLDNKITNAVANSITTIEQTGTGYFKLADTGGFVVPVGLESQRPLVPVVGMTRYNTTIDRLEIYNGNQWQFVVASVQDGVTRAEAEDIALTLAIILG